MKIMVNYFAVMREQRGLSSESLETSARTIRELFHDLSSRHGFTLDPGVVRVAVGEAFADMGRALRDGDSITFIPPVASG